MRVKPERRGVSYPASSCGPLAAQTTNLAGRRVTLSHDSTARGRPPRKTTTLAVAHDVVRPTPIGQVLFFLVYFLHTYSLTSFIAHSFVSRSRGPDQVSQLQQLFITSYRCQRLSVCSFHSQLHTKLNTHF